MNDFWWLIISNCVVLYVVYNRIGLMEERVTYLLNQIQARQNRQASAYLDDDD